MNGKWINCGDFHYLDHGGCLIRNAPGGYDVISLTTGICDYKGKFKKPCIIAKCYIDFASWLKDSRKKINSFAGYDEDYVPLTEDEEMSYCVDLINYFGIQEFDSEFPEETGCGPYAIGTIEHWIVGRQIAKRFLKEHSVPYELRS